MNKQDNNQQQAASTTQEVFKDFKSPKSTDGSYMGKIKQSKAVETHLEHKFQEKLEEVKQRLKAGKCKVGITVKGSAIQLQATLPPKPDSGKDKPYQQLISLGIPANLDGLKTAEEEAYALATLIARKQFEWNEKYLGTKREEVKILTIGELLEKFEEEYFKTRPFHERAKRNIRLNKILKIRKYCDLSALPTSGNFTAFIKAVPTDGAKEGLLVAIKLLISVFKLNIDLSHLKVTSKPQKRNIPPDDTIEESFGLFKLKAETRKSGVRQDVKDTWKLKSWMYGMLAVFGLRPHELLTKPDIEWWLSKKNIDSTWKVHPDCKTGERETLPLNKHWIDLFELKNPERLVELQQLIDGVTTIAELDYEVQNLSKWFKNVGIPFKPYDLRHAWAIRAHMLGIPVKVAAQNLGHGVDIHTKTYQRWFTLDNCKAAINQALEKKSEVELLQEQLQQQKLEIEQLKLELEQAKLENERLRLQFQFSKLNN